MKIRNGFVSNSSTSSFLVAFDKIPHSSQEMKEMVFGNQNFIRANWQDDTDSPTQTIELAKLLYEDTVNFPCPPSDEEAISFFMGKVKFKESRFTKKIQTPNGIQTEYDWEKAYEYKRKKAKPLFYEFIERNKGKFIYMFSQGSDYGYISSIIESEYESIFKNFDYAYLNEH